MKIWLVGPQGTCKRDIYRLLAKNGFRCGKLFTNATLDDVKYNKYLYKYFPTETINDMFENGSNLFVCSCGEDQENIYTGLDFCEYDDNDVFVLTPEQFVGISRQQYLKDGLVVWLDGGWVWRKNNISYDEYRTPDDPTYNYNDVERIESSFARHFYRAMTELAATAKNVLYFHEENPTRVKTIIKTIALNPKLKSEFIREFDPARTAADTLAKE